MPQTYKLQFDALPQTYSVNVFVADGFVPGGAWRVFAAEVCAAAATTA
jgi:hypothetical protein